MPWYEVPACSNAWRVFPFHRPPNPGLRFPVQYVIRAGDFRGFAGRIAAGCCVWTSGWWRLPSGRSSRVRSISDRGMANSWRLRRRSRSRVCLDDEIDIRPRRAMLVSRTKTGHRPAPAFEATLVWMSERPLHAGRAYLVKNAAQTVRAARGCGHRAGGYQDA